MEEVITAWTPANPIGELEIRRTRSQRCRASLQSTHRLGVKEVKIWRLTLRMCFREDERKSSSAESVALGRGASFPRVATQAMAMTSTSWTEAWINRDDQNR